MAETGGVELCSSSWSIACCRNELSRLISLCFELRAVPPRFSTSPLSLPFLAFMTLPTKIPAMAPRAPPPSAAVATSCRDGPEDSKDAVEGDEGGFGGWGEPEDDEAHGLDCR